MIYLDNAATTKPYDEAVEAALKYMTKEYGNPGGSYTLGETAKSAVEDARAKIAKTLNTKPERIIFTSGGSESDNLAITGIPDKNRCHIITTKVEHKAVLNTCAFMEHDLGYDVTYLDPDERGLITAKQVENAIRPDTCLVSVMAVNNEIGTVMPIKEIGKVCRKHDVLFHVDAVQGYGHIPIDVKAMKIDMLSASAHKFHGIKGTGFLYSRIPLIPFIFGGSQERGLRAGTENVPAIVAMGVAAEKICKNMPDTSMETIRLRDHMIERILNEIPGSRLNGSLVARCPNNVNVSIPRVNGDTLLILLNDKGICASTGSACNSHDSKPSHVLKAIGLTDKECRGSIRFTLSEFTTIDEVNTAVDVLKHCVEVIDAVSEK